jgi:hypothetical protein
MKYGRTANPPHFPNAKHRIASVEDIGVLEGAIASISSSSSSQASENEGQPETQALLVSRKVVIFPYDTPDICCPAPSESFSLRSQPDWTSKTLVLVQRTLLLFQERTPAGKQG